MGTNECRDWDAAIAEARGEPVRFKLGGEEFQAPRPLPATSILSFVAREKDSSDNAVVAFRSFLIDCVAESDAERLSAAIETSKIGVEQLIELAQWVIEETAGHPTQRQSDSPGLPLPTGEPSKDDSGSQVVEIRSLAPLGAS